MASYDKLLSDFVAKFGEESVSTALTNFVTAKERSKAWSAKHKLESETTKKVMAAAKTDPEIAKKLRALGINL